MNFALNFCYIEKPPNLFIRFCKYFLDPTNLFWFCPAPIQPLAQKGSAFLSTKIAHLTASQIFVVFDNIMWISWRLEVFSSTTNQHMSIYLHIQTTFLLQDTFLIRMFFGLHTANCLLRRPQSVLVAPPNCFQRKFEEAYFNHML